LVVVLVAIAGARPGSVFVAEANGVDLELADGEFEIDPERIEDRDKE